MPLLEDVNTNSKVPAFTGEKRSGGAEVAKNEASNKKAKPLSLEDLMKLSVKDLKERCKAQGLKVWTSWSAS
jgi:hypothetical protein